MRLRIPAGLIVLLGAAVALVSPVPSTVPLQPPSERGQSAMDDQVRRRIDAWIARNGLNSYGDPPGTMYAGGTPLFNESTGEAKDRYLYILERHPELKEDGTRKR